MQAIQLERALRELEENHGEEEANEMPVYRRTQKELISILADTYLGLRGDAQARFLKAAEKDREEAGGVHFGDLSGGARLPPRGLQVPRALGSSPLQLADPALEDAADIGAPHLQNPAAARHRPCRQSSSSSSASCGSHGFHFPLE